MKLRLLVLSSFLSIGALASAAPGRAMIYTYTIKSPGDFITSPLSGQAKDDWTLNISGSFTLNFAPQDTNRTFEIVSSSLKTVQTNPKAASESFDWGVCTGGGSPSAAGNEPCIKESLRVTTTNPHTFGLVFQNSVKWPGSVQGNPGNVGISATDPLLLFIGTTSHLDVISSQSYWCTNDCNGNGNRINVSGVQVSKVPAPIAVISLLPLTGVLVKTRRRFASLDCRSEIA